MNPIFVLNNLELFFIEMKEEIINSAHFSLSLSFCSCFILLTFSFSISFAREKKTFFHHDFDTLPLKWSSKRCGLLWIVFFSFFIATRLKLNGTWSKRKEEEEIKVKYFLIQSWCLKRILCSTNRFIFEAYCCQHRYHAAVSAPYDMTLYAIVHFNPLVTQS